MSWINCWAMFSSCGGWGRPVNTTTKNNKNSSYHRDIQTPSQRQKFTIFFLENYAQNWEVLETESKTSYAYTTIKQTKDKVNRYYKGLCKWLHESSYWKVLLTTKRRRSWWGSWALRSNIPRFCVKRHPNKAKRSLQAKASLECQTGDNCDKNVLFRFKAREHKMMHTCFCTSTEDWHVTVFQ